MPTPFKFDEVPAGVSLTSTLDGENVLISSKAYFSSEDGNDFLTHIEAVWGYFSNVLCPSGLQPSQVDHFLAVIDRNKTATLYVNELRQQVSARIKRPIKAGQHIFRDDLAGIEELVFHDAAGQRIEIPPDNGLVLILSVGWRKCLYYDFEALITETPPRSLNMPRLFGRFHQQLLFQDMYSITDEQWDGMLAWGWFPFIWMTQDDRKRIIHFSARVDKPQSVFDEVCTRFQAVVKDRSASWQRLSFFQDHKMFVDKAVEHYLRDDYLSSIQVLYPRIEGIMRRLHLLNQPGAKPHQKSMAEEIVKNHDDYSLLLPAQFRKYLLGFYFRAFNEATGDVPLSRNSVAHGTSLPSDYDFVKASLGFMICDQIFYFLCPTQNGQP